MEDDFVAIFPGEISREERIALAHRRLRLHENGAGLRSAYRSPEDGPFAAYVAVTLSAPSAEHARRAIIDALAREPDQLRVHKGRAAVEI